MVSEACARGVSCVVCVEGMRLTVFTFTCAAFRVHGVSEETCLQRGWARMSVTGGASVSAWAAQPVSMCSGEICQDAHSITCHALFGNAGSLAGDQLQYRAQDRAAPEGGARDEAHACSGGADVGDAPGGRVRGPPLAREEYLNRMEHEAQVIATRIGRACVCVCVCVCVFV